jgi:hypothetical protein
VGPNAARDGEQLSHRWAGRQRWVLTCGELDATEHCRSERRGDDVVLKFSMLSSGCESRPAKAEPGRPVASLAVRPVTGGLMRRYASVWAVVSSQRKHHSGTPRVSARLKAAAATPRDGWARGRGGRRGDWPRHVRRGQPGNSGDPDAPTRSRRGPRRVAYPNSPTDARRRRHARTGQEKPPSGVEVQGEGNRSRGPMCVWESEGRIVCAGQRTGQEGSSPSSARIEGAVSKGGGNASPAGAWRRGRYGEA